MSEDQTGAGSGFDTLRVLRQGQFAAFFVGNSLTQVAMWMQKVAAAWLVWEWTQSAFWIGILAACDLLPVLLVGPIAGVAADRWNTLRQNQLAQAVASVVAVVSTVFLVTGLLSLAGLLVLVVIQGVVASVVQPARMAMVQDLVSREDVPMAVGLNSISFNLARLLGPALAGSMIVLVDVNWVYALAAAFISIFVLILGRLKLLSTRARPPEGRFWKQMLEGFVFIGSEGPIRLVMALMVLGGVLVRSAQELIPALAGQLFDSSAVGLAVLTSASAGGALLAALSTRRTSRRRLLLGPLIWWSVGSVAAVALYFSPGAVPAVACATILGGSITRSNISMQTYLQLEAPEALRGRVLSALGLVARGSPAVGTLVLGYVADRLGLSLGILIACSLMLVVVLVLRNPMVEEAPTD